MAKTVVQKISDAITGNGRIDIYVFQIENDQQVIAAKKAEADATANAHRLEEGLGQLVSDRAHADAEYTRLAGLPDETGVREGRRKFIAADEAVRGRQDQLRRAQLAATAARQKREQVEIEAEVRIAAAIRERLAAITACVVKAVETELIPAFIEAEQVIDAAESLSSWGSAAARRIGHCAGLGTTGRALFRARGTSLTSAGEHPLGAILLPSPYVNEGSVYGLFKRAVSDLGLLE